MNKIVPFVLVPSVLGLTWVAAARVMPPRAPLPRRFTRTFEMSGIHRIYLKIPSGVATVVADSPCGLQMEETRWLSGPLNETSQHWLNTAKLSVAPAGDRLNVTEDPSVAKDQPKAGLAVTLHVPAGTDVDLNVDAGTLETRGSFHSLVAEVGAGRVVDHVDRCPDGPTRIEVASGDARVELPDDSNATVNATVGIGRIIGLPKVETTSLTKSDDRSGVIGSGKSKYNVRVGTGEFILTAPTPFQIPSQANERGQAAERFQSADQPRQNSPLSDQDLDRIRKDVEKAMKRAQPQIDRALKQIQPEMERELAKIGPEIKRAMRTVKAETQKVRREHRQEFDRELARAKPEIKRAIAEAMRAIHQATSELDQKDMKEIDPNGKLKNLVQAAMDAARQALKDALPNIGKGDN
jgi:hypothetical protein